MKLKLFILACMLIIHVNADIDVEYDDESAEIEGKESINIKLQ